MHTLLSPKLGLRVLDTGVCVPRGSEGQQQQRPGLAEEELSGGWGKAVLRRGANLPGKGPHPRGGPHRK